MKKVRPHPREASPKNAVRIRMFPRIRAKVKAVFVFPGPKIDLTRSAPIVLSLCRGYRIPEPLRQAHPFVNSRRRSEVRA